MRKREFTVYLKTKNAHVEFSCDYMENDWNLEI